MRTLKFIANAQDLRPDPTCDFDGLVKGTKGYLRAEFNFSKEYSGCGKIAVFEKLGEKYPVKLENNACMIPEEAITWDIFKVSVIGIKPDYRICTKCVEVRQND